MKIEETKNFKKLSEKVTTSGIVPEQALKLLSSQGYEAVINLLPPSHEKSVPNERELVEAQGLEYISIPVEWSCPNKSEV